MRHDRNRKCEKEQTNEHVKQGGNSHTMKIKRGGESYCLKIYNQTTNVHGENKAEIESRFLRYLEKQGITTTPRLIESSLDGKWIVMTWLEGVRVGSLSRDLISSAVEFLERSNMNRYLISELENASEACINPNIMIQNIRYKLQMVESTIREINTAQLEALTDWIRRDFYRLLNDAEKKARVYCEQELWEGSRELIASPSDVGIHNMLISQKGEFLFFDFEHAGKDDIAKFVCDWCLRPGNGMTEKFERQLINEIEVRGITKDGAWIKRYEQIKPIAKLAWCIIYLRKKIIRNKDFRSSELIRNASELFLADF